VQRLRFRRRGRWRELDADLVLVHQGVVPDINLPGAVGCALEWNPRQCAFQPRVDPSGRTTVPGLSVAGDAAVVRGAALAEASGRLTALDALMALGVLAPEEAAMRQDALRRTCRSLARGRAFLDTLYLPRAAFRVPADDDTVVCRCEEVRAGQIRSAIALGAPGVNQVKTFLRCGMGPCQGRMCAATVTEMVAAERRACPEQVGTFRTRVPVKPVTLAEMASIPATPEALIAVTGEATPLD
jgi:NADPH-dependent 2,4-dienoyl-CoA reductase/sulfur reductase-like enzyme